VVPDWVWVRQPTRRRWKTYIRNYEEGTGKTPRFIFPRRDMDCTIILKDNGVNEADSQGLAELHLTGNDVRSS